MALGKNWSEWWRRFLDLSTNESCTVVDILRERYVGEMQQADRLKQYAREDALSAISGETPPVGDGEK